MARSHSILLVIVSVLMAGTVHAQTVHWNYGQARVFARFNLGQRG